MSHDACRFTTCQVPNAPRYTLLPLQVWPGQAVFPDYMFNPAAGQWLQEQLAAWHASVPFDGLWLDMNEPASFCEGTFCEADAGNDTAMHCEWGVGGGVGGGRNGATAFHCGWWGKCVCMGQGGGEVGVRRSVMPCVWGGESMK
jgi:alpha-glucosidase (family GH31 glycosyl hydrolase)